MSDRYFTASEVEALLPRLSAIVERAMGAQAAVAAARGRLRSEQRRVELAGGGVVNRAAWRRDVEAIARATEATQQGLDEILQLGGVAKDLEMGLVDFPHLREGREVNLCWRYGEDRIRFWHGLNEGFAGRKPL